MERWEELSDGLLDLIKNEEIVTDVLYVKNWDILTGDVPIYECIVETNKLTKRLARVCNRFGNAEWIDYSWNASTDEMSNEMSNKSKKQKLSSSELITAAFNDAFCDSYETDVELINNKFENVLENPLDYITFKNTRVPDYHNDYRLDTEFLMGYSMDTESFTSIQKGIYTTFPVHSKSSVEIKRKVSKDLKDRFLITFKDVVNSKLPKDYYFIYIKHNEQ